MAGANPHRRALLPLYLPAMLLGVPAQASFVLLPLYVLDLGGSVAAAAAVVGWRGIGMMVMDVPAGMLAARIGDRAVMLLASVVLGAAFLGYALCESVTGFYAIAFVNGCGSSTFLLGRMAYISSTCAGSERGRVIAMIAGSMRAAALIGPLAGGFLAAALGYSATFFIATASILAGLVIIALNAERIRPHGAPLEWHAIPRLALSYRRVFLTAGTAAISFMLMRAARTVLMPLAGAALGLDAPAIGAVVALSALVDVALFYPAGVLMDRRGRRATAVPSSVLFALMLLGIALVDSHAALLAVAVALGIANGLSTGIVMTLGTDHAPATQRGEFLGLWRLLTDFGSAAGPMVVSSLLAVAPLGLAAAGVALLGGAGSWVVYRYVEETLPGKGDV
ncbi:MAG: MFS transporter [Gammaproteobacteria bacterium]